MPRSYSGETLASPSTHMARCSFEAGKGAMHKTPYKESLTTKQPNGHASPLLTTADRLRAASGASVRCVIPMSLAGADWSCGADSDLADSASAPTRPASRPAATAAAAGGCGGRGLSERTPMARGPDWRGVTWCRGAAAAATVLCTVSRPPAETDSADNSRCHSAVGWDERYDRCVTNETHHQYKQRFGLTSLSPSRHRPNPSRHGITMYD